MDGVKFDLFIKQLGTTRLTRLTALRGLVAGGAAALTGVGLTREAGAKKKNNDKEIRICICSSADPTTCRSKKKDKDKAKKTLRRNACAYRGRCQSGVSGCGTQSPPGLQCTNNTQCTGGLVCINTVCVACTADAQCSGGQVCISGRCQQPPTPPECQNNNQCTGGRICLGGTCVDCTVQSAINQCTGGQICVQGRCAGGEQCVNPTGMEPDPCPDPLECREAGNNSGLFLCLLGGSQGSPGQGACPPREDRECPESGGVQTVCVLSRCLRPCESDAECEAADQGTCRSGFCIEDLPTPP